MRLVGTDGSLGRAAELDDGTPIPMSVLARLACDAEITRIVFGPQGQPLDVGRAKRTYAGAQRHAVIARDRHCQYPGCDAPPVRCEVHHIRWWSRGGATSVSNGILVCWYHHRVVHQRDLTIRPRAGGGWEVFERDGRAVGPPGGVERKGQAVGPPGGVERKGQAVGPPGGVERKGQAVGPPGGVERKGQAVGPPGGVERKGQAVGPPGGVERDGSSVVQDEFALVS